MRKLQSIGIFNTEINGTLQWDDTDVTASGTQLLMSIYCYTAEDRKKRKGAGEKINPQRIAVNCFPEYWLTMFFTRRQLSTILFFQYLSHLTV